MKNLRIYGGVTKDRLRIDIRYDQYDIKRDLRHVNACKRKASVQT
jgi:hypothetical protein